MRHPLPPLAPFAVLSFGAKYWSPGVHPSYHVAKMLNIVGWFDKHRTDSAAVGGGS